MNAEQTSIFFVALAYHVLRMLDEEELAQRVADAEFWARQKRDHATALEGGNEPAWVKQHV
jgi:hypothetical protein